MAQRSGIKEPSAAEYSLAVMGAYTRCPERRPAFNQGPTCLTSCNTSLMMPCTVCGDTSSGSMQRVRSWTGKRSKSQGQTCKLLHVHAWSGVEERSPLSQRNHGDGTIPSLHANARLAFEACGSLKREHISARATMRGQLDPAFLSARMAKAIKS